MKHLICRECKKEISAENLVKYGGGLGYRKLCKPCRNKISRKNNRKKAEALKQYKSFWS